jgi:nucleoside-diphosphate-sugar epimerase
MVQIESFPGITPDSSKIPARHSRVANSRVNTKGISHINSRTKMRVGVTGGTGLIGRALVRRLRAENVEVQLLARPGAQSSNLEGRGVRIITGDLRDEAAIARVVAGADTVFHLAAKVDSTGPKSAYLEANVQGTEAVLKASHAAKVQRVVCASSIAVYGLVKPGETIDETTAFDDRPERRDFYAQSKILADRLASSFSRKTGLPVTILRPGIVFGPGRALPIGLLGFHAGRTNIVFGNRNDRIPLIYIENLVDAMQLAATTKSDGLQEFNIIDDEDLTLESYHRARNEIDGTNAIFFPGGPIRFAAAIVDAAGQFLPAAAGVLSGHQVKRALQDRRYATRRIREALGWGPRVPLWDALRQSVRQQHKE